GTRPRLRSATFRSHRAPIASRAPVDRPLLSPPPVLARNRSASAYSSSPSRPVPSAPEDLERLFLAHSAVAVYPPCIRAMPAPAAIRRLARSYLCGGAAPVAVRGIRI